MYDHVLLILQVTPTTVTWRMQCEYNDNFKSVLSVINGELSLPLS